MGEQAAETSPSPRCLVPVTRFRVLYRAFFAASRKKCAKRPKKSKCFHRIRIDF
jgi:hypothetical protein